MESHAFWPDLCTGLVNRFWLQEFLQRVDGVGWPFVGEGEEKKAEASLARRSQEKSLAATSSLLWRCPLTPFLPMV
jgi:hypothetical protein